jgi:hypothetical protein
MPSTSCRCRIAKTTTIGAATITVAAATIGHCDEYWPKKENRPRVTGHKPGSLSMTTGRMRLFQLATKPNT